MNTFNSVLVAAAAIGGLAAPAAAQYAPYPQPLPGQPVYGQPVYGQPGYAQPYGQPGYGQQPYGYNNNPVNQIINQLLGNRYNVSDRTAISQCASAAIQQAGLQYQRQPYGNAYGYNNNRGYNQGYNGAANMRVTAITDVQRRQNSLRVSGLIDSRGGYAPNGQAYGYQNQGYAATGDLSFRCNVDYRGTVTNVRINRANTYRR